MRSSAKMALVLSLLMGSVGGIDTSSAAPLAQPQAVAPAAALAQLDRAKLAASNAAQGLPTQFEDQTIEYLMNRDNVSSEEAVKILMLEEQIQGLYGWLQKNRSDTFTSLEVLHSPFGVRLKSLGGGQEVLKGAPVGDLIPLIAATTGTSTEEQMRAEGQAMLDQVRGKGRKVDVDVRYHEEKIIFHTRGSEVAAVKVAAAEAGRASRTGMTLEVVGDNLAEPSELMAHGGLVLDTPLGQCTTGFGAIRSDGLRVLMTAGHCNNNSNKVDVGGTSYVYHGSTQMQFVLDYEHFGGNQDIQQMYGGQCCIAVNNRVQDNSTDTASPRYRLITRVDTAARPVGLDVEKWGRITGYTAGRITANGYAPNYVPNPSPAFAVADYGRAGGDSGGPVYQSNSAVGIHSGFTGGGSAAVFMPISNESMNSTVLTY